MTVLVPLKDGAFYLVVIWDEARTYVPVVFGFPLLFFCPSSLVYIPQDASDACGYKRSGGGFRLVLQKK